MRPLFYTIILSGLFLHAPPALASATDGGLRQARASQPIALNKSVTPYGNAGLYSKNAKPHSNNVRQFSKIDLNNRINAPWNLDLDIQFYDFRKKYEDLIPEKPHSVNLNDVIDFAGTEIRVIKHKINRQKRWYAFGKEFVAKREKAKRQFLLQRSKKNIIKRLQSRGSNLSGPFAEFYGREYAFPLKLYHVITENGHELILPEDRLADDHVGTFRKKEVLPIDYPEQKIQLHYKNGLHRTVNIEQLLQMAENRDSFLFDQLVLIDALDRGQKAKSHPLLDPLVMAYRSLRGHYTEWRADKSFYRHFLYEKIRWQTPEDNLVKFMLPLHLKSREHIIRFKGDKMNYRKIGDFISAAPVDRNYDNWTEYVYSFSNRITFLPVGPDPNYPQLVVHRSQPIYKGARTTVFDVTFSLIENGQEERVFITGNQYEKVLMISNTFADALGDNYLHGENYTLSFEPMPSHLEWPNTIRVTEFGVFIHRGQSAKRYAGCKGITTTFDYKTMTMPVWASMHSLKMIRKVHDKKNIPKGNFYLKNNSYAPGAKPSTVPEDMPIVVDEEIALPTAIL